MMRLNELELRGEPSDAIKSKVLKTIADLMDRADLAIHLECHQGVMDLGNGMKHNTGMVIVLKLDGGDKDVLIDVIDTSCCG